MMNWFYRLGIAHHHAQREGETIKSPGSFICSCLHYNPVIQGELSFNVDPTMNNKRSYIRSRGDRSAQEQQQGTLINGGGRVAPNTNGSNFTTDKCLVETQHHRCLQSRSLFEILARVDMQ